jgi:hypothetical protein
MMASTTLLSVLIILATLLTSCRRENSPATEQRSGGDKSSATYVESSIRLDKTVRHSSSGAASSSGAVAYLHNLDSAGSVDAGTFTINGVVIPKWHSNPATWYQTRDVFTIPVSYDGSMNRFQASGGAGFPAFADSCPSPDGLTSIIFPGTSDTVSKARGFTLTWSSNAPSDEAEVQITDSSSSTKHLQFFRALSSDPGTLTISASDLERLYPGPIEITVARGNDKRGNLSISKKYRIRVTSTDIVHAYLK